LELHEIIDNAMNKSKSTADPISIILSNCPNIQTILSEKAEFFHLLKVTTDLKTFFHLAF